MLRQTINAHTYLNEEVVLYLGMEYRTLDLFIWSAKGRAPVQKSLDVDVDAHAPHNGHVCLKYKSIEPMLSRDTPCGTRLKVDKFGWVYHIRSIHLT